MLLEFLWNKNIKLRDEIFTLLRSRETLVFSNRWNDLPSSIKHWRLTKERRTNELLLLPYRNIMVCCDWMGSSLEYAGKKIHMKTSQTKLLTGSIRRETKGRKAREREREWRKTHKVCIKTRTKGKSDKTTFSYFSFHSDELELDLRHSLRLSFC